MDQQISAETVRVDTRLDAYPADLEVRPADGPIIGPVGRGRMWRSHSSCGRAGYLVDMALIPGQPTRFTSSKITALPGPQSMGCSVAITRALTRSPTESPPMPGKPHDAARWAVGNLVAAGLTPAQALRACTSQAALACGLQGRKGRLAVGHDADILAVLGNPLDDPSTLHRINAVFVRGTRLEHIPN